MGETYGVPVAEIVEASSTASARSTSILICAWLPPAIRKYMAENSKDFDPRKYLAAARKAMKEICKARYEASVAPAWRRRSSRLPWRKWPSATRRAN